MVSCTANALATGLTVLALPFAVPQVRAQTLSAAHDDAEWEHDRQAPYPGAGWLESSGGSAPVDFPRAGIDLRSWISLTEFDPATTAANDCWGYVSPSGREYALIGLSLGTAFVEVTEPGNAQIVEVISGPASSWRDIKTYQQFAYAVSEGGGGIQVFDLSQIDSGIVALANTITTGGRLESHDVAINTESGRLYRAGGGGNNPVNGLRIYDLASPTSPAFLAEWNDRYCHDAQVVTWTDPPYAGAEVAFCYANDTTSSGNPGIEILDVSDPSNISGIGSINLAIPPIFSHPAYYSHQGWLSPDRHYVYVNDEVDEGAIGNPTTTRIVDVSDISNPIQVAIFSNGNTARDHNLYTQGNLIFEANYRSGLRVFSASDPLAPSEIAYFDTYPADDNANYNGLWGVYPYLPSGTIVGSDIERGLFVWTFSATPVPALSTRGALSVVLAIAIAGIAALRSRRPPAQLTLLTIALLAAIGLGCGSQETGDSGANGSNEPESKSDRPRSPRADTFVEYSDGRVTVRSDGAPRLAILERLAAQVGFEIVAGGVDERPIALQIERASLIEAIARILDGYSYTLGYDLDEASGTRVLARIEVGKPLANTAPNNAAPARDQASSGASRAASGARGDRAEPANALEAKEQAELLSKLDSPDPEERADAADWIDLEGEGLERVISLLETDPDPDVRITIVDRLGDDASPAALSALAVALRDPNPEVVLRSIEALEFEAGDWLIPELESLLSHPDPEIREAAAEAIDSLQ